MTALNAPLNAPSESMTFFPEQAKRRIVAGMRDLDRSDYHDICVMIKTVYPKSDNKIITVSARGTHVNLDNLDDDLLKQLDDKIASKIQRIYANRK
jgi:hypothetical protein